jgi:colanic acid biosynthesis glycosyl transferase WcaI
MYSVQYSEGREAALRILFITYYYEPDLGAAAVRLSRLAKLLQQRGHEVTVLTSMPHYPQGRIHDGYRGKLMTDENRDGIRVIQVWLWATPSKKITRRLVSQVSFMLTCALRGIFLPRPDVIFIENQPIFAGLSGWFISRLKRRPYLLNVSDYWPEYLLAVGVLKRSNPLYRLFEALVNLTQRHADAIVALLPGLLQSIEQRIGQVKRGQVIRNAADLQRFRPDLDTTAFREKHGLGDSRLITFVGTLGNHIDLETMLDVAEAFEGRNDVYFVFVGTGIQREILNERVKALTRTRWIGWLDHSEVPLAWAASFLTYWAIHENELNRISFSSKLYEALASGVPPVVAVEGMIADTLAHSGAGKTVAFGDKQGLIHEIQHLLDHPEERDAMSRNARAYAEAHFDPAQVADAYEATLRSLLPG